MKSVVLNEMARTTVGDGGNPNMFFVSVKGNIQLVTLNLTLAYDFWKSLGSNQETCLEDRKQGTICSVEPEEDDSTKLVVIDDLQGFKRFMKNRKQK